MGTELASEHDLEWAKEVHGLPAEAEYAILHGTEDAPTKIEYWLMPLPLFDDPPLIWALEP